MQPRAELGGARWLQVPVRVRVMVVESAQTPSGSMLRGLAMGGGGVRPIGPRTKRCAALRSVVRRLPCSMKGVCCCAKGHNFCT